MTNKFAKLVLATALGLAITFTLNACGKGGGDKLLECIADESGKCTTKFEYDNQNRIVKVNDETITYTDNLITVGTKKYVIKENEVTVDGESSYTIDKDGYIINICGGDEECTSLIYKDNNLIESHGGGGVYNDIYSYDDKKSPFSNSNTPKWVIQLLPSMDYDFRIASKNNLLKHNWEEGGSKGEYIYKYEYDSDGFPTTKKSVNGNEEKTITRYIYRGEPQAATASGTEATETATEDKPKFFECDYSNDTEDAKEAKWSMGVANDDCTRLVGGSSEKYTRAVFGSQMYKIKYIGKKKERREEREMEFYFANYETSCGAEYEIIGSKGKTCRTLFLYNESDKWGGVPANIVFKDFGENRPKVGKDDIAAMEKLQNGRKVILSEVIADFSIEGKSNRLMLARYKNSKKDGLFQIVLRDHNNDYFTVDFPSDLDENGQPNWRADMGEEIGSWSLYFVGKVAEGLFLVTEWCAAEGCGTTTFVAKNGKLEDWQGKNITEASAESQPSGEEGCPKEGSPITIEAVFLENDDSDPEGLAYSDFRLANGNVIKLNGSAPDDVKKGDKVSITYKKTYAYGNFGDGDRCYDFETLESVKKIGK